MWRWPTYIGLGVFYRIRAHSHSMSTRKTAKKPRLRKVCPSKPLINVSKPYTVSNARSRILQNPDHLVYRVPKEIWTVIFDFCLSSSDEEPFTQCNSNELPLLTSQVCQVWRDIMLSTTYYWSSIHIDISRRAPARQASIIKAWLNRSGLHRPLFISIQCPQMVMKRAQRFLGIFAPYTHRVKYLRFAGLAAYCNILLKEPFPILEILDLYHISKFVKDIWSTESLAALWGGVYLHDTHASKDIRTPESAFQLKRILLSRLDHNPSLSGSISLIHLHAPWQNITRLEWVPIISFEDIALVFRRCLFLKECLCVIPRSSLIVPPNIVFRHNHLQLLIIHLPNDMSAPDLLLNTLILPRLTHLEMHYYLEAQIPHSVLNDFFQRSLSFEKLASLKIYYDPTLVPNFDEFMWLVQALNRLVEFFVGYRRGGVEINLITEAMRNVINARLLV